jgi:hypothetical protein
VLQRDVARTPWRLGERIPDPGCEEVLRQAGTQFALWTRSGEGGPRGMSEGDSAVHLYGRRRRGIVSHAVTVRVVTICTRFEEFAVCTQRRRVEGVPNSAFISSLLGRSIVVPSLSTSLQAENGHEASLLSVSLVFKLFQGWVFSCGLRMKLNEDEAESGRPNGPRTA